MAQRFWKLGISGDAGKQPMDVGPGDEFPTHVDCQSDLDFVTVHRDLVQGVIWPGADSPPDFTKDKFDYESQQYQISVLGDESDDDEEEWSGFEE